MFAHDRGLPAILTVTPVDDDLPPVEPAFERVAFAADLAMYEVLADDLEMEPMLQEALS